MLAARTVTTTGSGRVALPRSVAVVRVTATHRAEALSEALAGAESARAAVVEVARRHVDPADAGSIATQSLDIWQTTDDQGRRVGHEARHSLSIRAAGLDAAAALVQALADEVGDRISLDGVSPASVPTADDHRTARERAFADARATAEHLADLAGAGLGSVVSIAEGATRGVARGGAADARLALAKTEVALEGGEEELTAAVTVVWELG
ncbi:SIMPL domain-containing protein [Nocardioides sp. 1609]|uniref:SIMPL domain-containing protein n=1 Tax=Nocardioides sp. 1609 TaxID=2508327 RepID=UPI0010702786|nr:SIMPL domain-containing protein [Nocardioides sp. 1609]